MNAFYHKNNTIQITVNIIALIIALFSLFGFANPVAASDVPVAPVQADHGVAVSAIFCKVNGSSAVKLSGTVVSWATGDVGTNPSVDVSFKAVYANNSTSSGFVKNDGLVAGNNYRIDFSALINSPSGNQVVKVDAIVEVKADWKDGNTNRPVIHEPAVFVGVCPDEIMKTATPEPETATPTKTATATMTPTKTKAPTATATATMAWDRSSVSVTVECVVGYTLFRVTNTGQSMTGDTTWQLLVNNVSVETGTYRLNAGQEALKIYAPGQYDGELTLIVYQRPGHPGASNPQASMKSDVCVNAPTNDPDTDEVSTITIRKIDQESGPTTSVYEVKCLPSSPGNKDIIVEILVTFTGDAPSEVRKGKYCDGKIYIDGSVEMVTLVGAIADPVQAFPTTTVTPTLTPTSTPSSRMFLPLVSR